MEKKVAGQGDDMRQGQVYAIASNIVSALGMNAAAHWQAVATGKTGIKEYDDRAFNKRPFFASRLDPAQWQMVQAQTASQVVLSPFEQLALYSAKQSLESLDEPIDPAQTGFILSTTKGNIEWLNQEPDERVALTTSARLIASQLGVTAKPIVISHACVSGVIALQYGMQLIRSGRYKNVIVTGCDRLSRFVLSGFESFHAIAHAPCRPFDAARKGINLGEAAGTIILSGMSDNMPQGQLVSGATSNDANHISGPSRTGEELADAISRTLIQAGITAAEINMISAHGTATIYNDEMEANAFALTALSDQPLHSMKGYIGHTLGAAGVVESVMVLESFKHQQLIPTLGFDTIGVSQPVNVTTQMTPAKLNYALKTASGFGGSNATVLWKSI